MEKPTQHQNGLKSKLDQFKVINLIGLCIAIGTAIFVAIIMGNIWLTLAISCIVICLVFSIFFSKTVAQSLENNNQLEAKILEKDMLLKEVHHRVKNNLQTVSSLLSLQSRAIQDDKIGSIIKSSQHRVVSMAMVHEMLHKRDDYSSKVTLKPYFKELCEYLIRSVKGNSEDIKLKLDVGDFKLSIDTVIPLGLIVNETVTNALKYGLPGDAKGEILVQLSKKGDNSYEMYLGDNGIGFPKDVNPKNTKSLGLKLIHNLSKQLRGSAQRDTTTNGTYYQVIFQEVVDDFNSID